MTGSALTLWLKDSGVSRSAIGYAGLIFSVYVFNFLWAPLIDRFHPFKSILAHRQAWITPCLLLICAACLLMSLQESSSATQTLVLIALVIAASSATQDIAIDAYRIDSFASEEQDKLATASAAATAGWWTGYAALGFVPLALSDHGWSWPQLYTLLAALSAIIALLSTLLPKPEFGQSNPNKAKEVQRWSAASAALGAKRKTVLLLLLLSPIALVTWSLMDMPGAPSEISTHAATVPLLIALGLSLAGATALFLARSLQGTNKQAATNYQYGDKALGHILAGVCAPIQDFILRNGLKLALQILLFMFLFKIGEAFLGRMSIVFYKEVGFSNTDIASYSKMLTWWVTIAGALFAGALNAHFGVIKGLLLSGIAMAASNLMFAWIALVGPSIPHFIAAVVIDGLATSWSLVAFVAFISALCNHQFSATQYALLASLGNLGRTTLSSLSGQLVDTLNGNWTLFFVITSLMVIPSLALLLKLAKQLQTNNDHNAAAAIQNHKER